MRWKIVTLVLVTSLLGFHPALADNLAIKATTPVEVSIYPVSSVNRGQASTFIVRATSSIPSENFIIEITPSDGSQLLSGELLWQGPITPGVPSELSITLRMGSDEVPSVSVTSSLQLGGEVQFAASATYRQQTQSPSAIQNFSRERKVSRKGRQVIEYSVK